MGGDGSVVGEECQLNAEPRVHTVDSLRFFYFNWNWRLRSDFENIDVITGSKQGHERV